jgi:hypothetical protein
VEADEDQHARAKAKSALTETLLWHDRLHHALEEVHVEHVGLLVDDYGGLLDDAYAADKKPVPSVRDARLPEVNERFLENTKKGVLYRVRR